MARRSNTENAEFLPDDENAPAPVEAAAPAEDLVEVLLLRNYVPANAKRVDGSDAFVKIPAGEVIKLPRTEAKRALALEIAKVTADLI